jgi:adenylate cyclase
MLRFLRLPNRIPVGLPTLPTNQKLLAALVIALGATAVALILQGSKPINDLRETMYDFAYTKREASDRKGGNIVIVEIDQRSLDRLGEGAIDEKRTGWPWPRELYGDMVDYLAKHGAKVVAFDVLMDSNLGALYALSDETFADVVNESPVKVVFGSMIKENGQPSPIAPPVKNPVYGAVNEEGGLRRTFTPLWNGYPSLAYRAVEAFTGSPPSLRESFRIHFYGPHLRAKNETTFQYVSAIDLLGATRGHAKEAGIPEDLFKDKIVLIGGTAPTLYDAKPTPLDPRFPGVEWQATAIENMLFHQRVVKTPPLLWGLLTFAGAFLSGAGSLMPKRTIAKLGGAAITLAAMFATGLLLFLGKTIYWLPMAVPLTAFLLSTVVSFAWSYFTEGRQRAFFSNVVALATSPEVAAEIGRDPDRIKLGGQRRDVTIMFTDLAGFTDFSEKMDVEKLTFVIQTYMEATSISTSATPSCRRGTASPTRRVMRRVPAVLPWASSAARSRSPRNCATSPARPSSPALACTRAASRSETLGRAANCRSLSWATPSTWPPGSNPRISCTTPRLSSRSRLPSR